MVENDKVSVIIPVWNGERYLRRAIDSALDQTYRNVEVLVVDDGSIDKTWEIIESYGTGIVSKRIEHLGASIARNIGISLATGSLLQFLDSDDWYEKDKTSYLVDLLKSENADIAWCRGRVHEPGKSSKLERYYPAPSSATDLSDYFVDNNPGTNSFLVRRDPVVSVGGFSAFLPRGQEWDFLIRLGRMVRVAASSDKVLYNIEVHAGQKISSKRADPGYETLLLSKIFLEKELFSSADREQSASLASSLAKHSAFAYRSMTAKGALRADVGFRVLELYSKSVCWDERSVVRTLYGWFGGAVVERALVVARRMKRLIRKA